MYMDTEEGIKVGGKLIKTLLLADDQAMQASRRMMDGLNRTTKEYEVKISTKIRR